VAKWDEWLTVANLPMAAVCRHDRICYCLNHRKGISMHYGWKIYINLTGKNYIQVSKRMKLIYILTT